MEIDHHSLRLVLTEAEAKSEMFGGGLSMVVLVPMPRPPNSPQFSFQTPVTNKYFPSYGLENAAVIGTLIVDTY